MKTQTVLSHMMVHTDWPHVLASFAIEVDANGETFSKPTERTFDSPAVMKAAKSLESAIAQEIAKADQHTTVRTAADVRREREAANPPTIAPEVPVERWHLSEQQRPVTSKRATRKRGSK